MGGEAADTVYRVIRRLQEGGDPTIGTATDAGRLLAELEPVARRACRSRAGGTPPERLEELVQDTLLVAWRRLPEFRAQLGGDSNRPRLAGWVRQIATFLAANARRRKGETLTEDGVVDLADPAAGPLAFLRREERDELVRRVIERALAGEEQDVLYHRHVHGLDRSAIAELLGLPDAEAVRVILQRAHRRLQAALSAALAELGAGPSLWRDELDG